MRSAFVQRALQVPCQHFRTCLCFKRTEVFFYLFIFFSQQQQQLKNLHYQYLFPHGSARVTKTRRDIFQPERQKHMQRSNPLLMTLATWKPAGVRGEREVMLAPFRLAAMAWQGWTGCSPAATSGLSDNLAGCSGARSRAAICSLPQPSCPEQPNFFSLEAGAPSLLFCACECLCAFPCGSGIL